MNRENKNQPGDIMLDSYFPEADHETRERARAAFRDFAFFLLRIGERLHQENGDRPDSPKLQPGATISEAHPEPTP